MYETTFGLREAPFDLSANPRYLLLTPGHTEALCHLQVGLASRGGLTLILGEPGTGKTTLLRHALGDQGSATRAFALTSPPSSAAAFLAQVSTALGVESTPSRMQVHASLAQRLADAPTGCALILDEAQALADEVLEECRLLGNVETATGERLAIVLVSQPELAARLRQPHFAALKQRVGARCVLRALTVQETGAYVAARVRLAGGDAGPLFSREAIRAIYESSGGIPRTINVLCHNTLLAIFGAGQPRVEFDTVADVCAGLDLPVPSRPQPAMAFSAAPVQKAPSRVRLALRFPRRTVEQAVR